MSKCPKISILGGGPAGIATAYYARSNDIDFELFEAAERFGGNCITFKNGDFRFDSGAHRLHAKDEDTIEIVKSLLGDNSDNLQGVKGLGIKTVVAEFPKLLTEKTNLDYIFKVAEEKLEGKKIFAKIIHNWDRVLTNFELMDLHNTSLDDDEKQYVNDVLKQPTPDLQAGAFLRLLEQDKIEGITKNTEGWLETFRDLTKV